MVEQIANLSNHYILCGAGRTGIYIAAEFAGMDIPCVVIERSAVVIEELQERFGEALYYIQGDATEDDVLEQAGIERALGLITTLRDDKDNVFVVLTARSLNPELRIVARVDDEEENAEKLRKAGADQIVPPSVVGGQEMASDMIRPEVLTFLDQMLRTPEKQKRLRFTQLPVDDIKILDAKTNTLSILDVGQQTGLLVLAIRHDGQYHYKPQGNTRLHRSTETYSGDVLIVVGTQAQLDKARGEGVE